MGTVGRDRFPPESVACLRAYIKILILEVFQKQNEASAEELGEAISTMNNVLENLEIMMEKKEKKRRDRRRTASASKTAVEEEALDAGGAEKADWVRDEYIKSAAMQAVGIDPVRAMELETARFQDPAPSDQQNQSGSDDSANDVMAERWRQEEGPTDRDTDTTSLLDRDPSTTLLVDDDDDPAVPPGLDDGHRAVTLDCDEDSQGHDARPCWEEAAEGGATGGTLGEEATEQHAFRGKALPGDPQAAGAHGAAGADAATPLMSVDLTPEHRSAPRE
eukprot:gene26737-32850_t